METSCGLCVSESQWNKIFCPHTFLTSYRSFIAPYLTYGLVAWGQASKSSLDEPLLKLQKRALCFIYFSNHKSSKKRFSADTEDHYISKHARITPADHLSFPFNPPMGNRLHTVKQILQVDMYEIVDLKVKIITKSQGKPSVMKNQVSMQKIDRYYRS